MREQVLMQLDPRLLVSLAFGAGALLSPAGSTAHAAPTSPVPVAAERSKTDTLAVVGHGLAESEPEPTPQPPDPCPPCGRG